ncbi:hypothetical protein MMP66_07730 [Acinetobacter dispersus]|nr:hypothetical protein [Acinetobacter dispersus]MCH7394169.1 hypothetical protein [Acinetobacter dispersus]
MGCQKSIVLSKPVIPANLLEPCPILNKIEDGSGKTVMIWAVNTVAKYNECDAKHAAVVDALRN